MARRKNPANEWVSRILRLRRRLNLTQSEFAARINYSAMALSRWESGAYEPTTEAYVQMGNLADGTESTWFWIEVGASWERFCGGFGKLRRPATIRVLLASLVIAATPLALTLIRRAFLLISDNFQVIGRTFRASSRSAMEAHSPRTAWHFVQRIVCVRSPSASFLAEP